MNVIESIRQQENHFADHLAVIDGDVWLSYREFYARVDALSEAFQRLGVSNGDVLLAWLPNSFQAIETELACLQIGAIWVTLNAGLTWAEVDDVVESTQPMLVVSDGSIISIDECELLHNRSIKTLLTDLDYEEQIVAENGSFVRGPIPLNHPARLRYTSGTTGRIKAAVLSHSVYKCSLDNLTNELQPLGTDDRVLHAAPLTHASGALMFPILQSGGANVVLPSFDVDAVLRTIQEEHITTLFCVPTMLQRLFGDERHRIYDLSSLKTISYGGAAMPVDNLTAIIESLGPKLMQIYGLTEATHPITTLLRDEHYAGNPKLGSIGKLTPYCELKVVGDDGITLEQFGPTHVGEFYARGPNCMDEYWRDPEATAETIIDGWIATGDLGYVDADGYYWIVDRKKDVIISGGFNVYSAEIEHVLMGYPGIHEAAVVGLAHSEWGEEVHGVVYTEDTLDAEELRVYCRERLAGYKCPKKITVANEPLPKNRSGKILKTVIIGMLIAATKEQL